MESLNTVTDGWGGALASTVLSLGGDTVAVSLLFSPMVFNDRWLCRVTHIWKRYAQLEEGALSGYAGFGASTYRVKQTNEGIVECHEEKRLHMRVCRTGGVVFFI